MSEFNDLIEAGDMKVELFTGNAIWYLAQAFRTPEAPILQYIQNALDASAKEVEIQIHLGKNTVKAGGKRKKIVEQPGSISVYDSGKGVSLATMQEKLRNISLSFKADDASAIGKDGLGLISSIAIAQELHFTSRDSKQGAPFFRIWILADEIKGKPEVSAHAKMLGPSFSLMDGSFNTLVQAKKVDPEVIRCVSNLEFLAEVISTSFSEKMISLGTEIRLVKYEGKDILERRLVGPQEFNGERQEEIEITNDFGVVSFDLYSTVVPVKKPKLLVKHSPKGGFTFDLSEEILHSLPEICKGVFKRGYLQGYIKINFGELTIERKDLKWGDERQAFVNSLENFCIQYGQPYIEAIEKEAKLDRFQEIVALAMVPIGQCLKSNPGLLPYVFEGVVSGGHVEARKGKPAGDLKKITKPYKSTPPSIKIVKNGSDGKKKEKTKERVRMVHVNVEASADGGKKRVSLSEGHQPGLTIRLEEGGFTRSRRDRGEIYINVGHPDFSAAADRNKNCAVLYVTMVILIEICYADTTGDLAKSFAKTNFDQLMKLFAQVIPFLKC